MVFFAFFSFILAMSDGFAQQNNNQTIVYDPIFWKDRLRLKDWQRIKINEINADFYGALIETAQTAKDKAEKENVKKLLNQRSEKIWNTFSSRQKSIWKRLESEYTASI
jgi:hypothetical protein